MLTIYTDFSFIQDVVNGSFPGNDHFTADISPDFKQSHENDQIWGVHKEKPPDQTKFENEVNRVD